MINSIEKRIGIDQFILVIVFLLFALFAYSRQSLGLLIPTYVWYIILGLGLSGLILMCFTLRKPLSFSFLELLFGLMILVISFNNNHSITDSFQHFILFISYIGLFLIYHLFSNAKNDKWFGVVCGFLIAISLFYSIMTIISFLNQPFYYRVIAPLFIRIGISPSFITPSAGLTGSTSNNGIYISLGLCTIIPFIFLKHSKNILYKVFLIVIMLLLVIGLFLSGKRGHMIGLIVAILIPFGCYSFGKKAKIFKYFLALVLFIIIFFLLYSLFPNLFLFITRSKELIDSGDVTNGRVQLWNIAWDYFIKNPLYGYGWRWFYYSPLIGRNMDVHNVFLQLLVENGVFMSAPFFLFIVISFLRAIKAVVLLSRNGAKKDLLNAVICLMHISFMIFYMFEGVVLYMSECMLTYIFFSASMECYVKMICNKKQLNNATNSYALNKYDYELKYLTREENN